MSATPPPVPMLTNKPKVGKLSSGGAIEKSVVLVPKKGMLGMDLKQYNIAGYELIRVSGFYRVRNVS